MDARSTSKWRWLSSWYVFASIMLLVVAGSAYFIFVFPYQPGYDEKRYLGNADALLSLEKGRLATWHFKYIAYSVLIAAGKAIFGLEGVGIKFLNLLMHVATCFMVYGFLSRRGRSPLAAPAGMFIAGTYPLALYMSGMIATETMFTFLLTAAAVCAVQLIEKDRWYFWPGATLIGLALALARPTGIFVALVLSIVGTVYYLLKRRSIWGALAVNAWILLYIAARVVLYQVYAPHEAKGPPELKAVAWLAYSTYLTKTGDSYAAVRQRQKEFARTHPLNKDIIPYLWQERNKLEAEMMAELRNEYRIEDTEHYYQLPSELLVRVMVKNFLRHPLHVVQYFAVNAFWRIWFTRDNMRHTGVLFVLNSPYLLLGILGFVCLWRTKLFLEFSVYTSIFFTIWSIHLLLGAISRFAVPFIPQFAVFGVLGLSAFWSRRSASAVAIES